VLDVPLVTFYDVAVKSDNLKRSESARAKSKLNRTKIDLFIYMQNRKNQFIIQTPKKTLAGITANYINMAPIGDVDRKWLCCL
jgi:hypothetical protein